MCLAEASIRDCTKGTLPIMEDDYPLKQVAVGGFYDCKIRA